MQRLAWLVLFFACVGARAQVIPVSPTDFYRNTHLSNHTRYGPGICGLTLNCQNTDRFYPASPISSPSYRCQEGISETAYRSRFGIPLNRTLSPSDFSGFNCNVGDATARCGRVPRFAQDSISSPEAVYPSTSCVCLDPCFTGPACTTPNFIPGTETQFLVANAASRADRIQSYLMCIQPFLMSGSTFDTINLLPLPPFDPPGPASLGMPGLQPAYDLWDTEEVKCRSYWFNNTQFANSRIVLPSRITALTDAVKQCPKPCSQFKGGQCPDNELCYRRTPQEMVSLNAAGGVFVARGGQLSQMKMDHSDVCCERGWYGFDCQEEIGCSKTGCDNGGTCLATVLNEANQTVTLKGEDIRCVNCDAGWTGRYCEISAPMWTSKNGTNVTASPIATASRRLLQQVDFVESCDIIRRNLTFKSSRAGMIYPEPGRACDCGVEWSTVPVASNETGFYRILEIGNYDADFSKLRHRLLSPIRYPKGARGSFNPVKDRVVSTIGEAQYHCYQDFFCDGFYINSTQTSGVYRVSFFSLLVKIHSGGEPPFNPQAMHLVDRLSAPTAYTRTPCADATLDPDYYCTMYPLQCKSIQDVGGVGNFRPNRTLTKAEVAELHFRMFGHQVRNSPRANCTITVDWLEDVSTCQSALRCLPGLPSRNGTGDPQRCGNATYIDTLQPLLRLLERINTFPQPFNATIGVANVISETGANTTCSCFTPFEPSNLQTYDDCAIDQCSQGLNQGLVNADHIGKGGVNACVCNGKWYTDPASCTPEGKCNWCSSSRCSNFGTTTKSDTCLCTAAFTGPFCTETLCNATNTNLAALTASTTPQVDCSGFCKFPFEGPTCNQTSCIHGVRSFDGQFSCLCPDNYALGTDGRCAELFCLAGRGTHVSKGVCQCQPQFGGVRCEIDLCAQPLFGNQIAGKAVPLDDGSWKCQCKWPFANAFPVNGTLINPPGGLCKAHFCGDYGYPSTLAWTDPSKACDCTRNRVNEIYEDFDVGVFTDPLKCTGASFEKCPKPCVQADCGLTAALANAAQSLKEAGLEATVSTVDGKLTCVCPQEFKTTIQDIQENKCRPFIPCTFNDRTELKRVNGTDVCTCRGIIDVAPGYYVSLNNSANCEVFIPVLDMVVLDPGFLGNTSNLVVNIPSSSSPSTILGISSTIFIAAVGLVLVLFVLLGKWITSLCTANRQSSLPVAPAMQNTTFNVVIPKGTGGRKGKGSYFVLVICLLGLLTVVNAQVPLAPVQPLTTLVGTVPGATAVNTFNSDLRKTYWADWSSYAYQIPNANRQTGDPAYIEVDLSGYTISSPPAFTTGAGSVRHYSGGIVEIAFHFALRSITPGSIPPVRIGNQLFNASDVFITDIRTANTVNSADPVQQNRYINLCGLQDSAGNFCRNNGHCVFPSNPANAGLTRIPATAFAMGQTTIINNNPSSQVFLSSDVFTVYGFNTHQVLGCFCNDGFTGRECERTCGSYTPSQLGMCNNRGNCSSYPNNLVTKNGAASAFHGQMNTRTCSCPIACTCQQGYTGDNCEFAIQTASHPFTVAGVVDYSACCMSGSPDCAPKWNPVLGNNYTDSVCTPTIKDDTACPFNRIDDETRRTTGFKYQTGLPMYTEFLNPKDNCRQALKQGVCWQGQLESGSAQDNTKTFCWCNQPAAINGSLKAATGNEVRGYTGPGCTRITCTKKTWQWPPDVVPTVNLVNVELPNERASRCSGSVQSRAGAKQLLDPQLASSDMCDDKVRPSFLDAYNKTNVVVNEADYRKYRINTLGDCTRCSPGWGMIPIDHNELPGTEYFDQWAVLDAEGVPNWNGVCSHRTFHDSRGNVCGGYGQPIYGPSYHFKLTGGDSTGYRTIRSVVGCVCPAGTVSLNSGICQRTVASKDAEDNPTPTEAEIAGCGDGGGSRMTIGANSVCSCNVNTLQSFNGPNCKAIDTRLYGNSSLSCANGQYTYFNGLLQNYVDTTNTTHPSSGAPDEKFVQQVIAKQGSNKVKRGSVVGIGLFDSALTKRLNPNHFNSSHDTPEKIFARMVQLSLVNSCDTQSSEGVYTCLPPRIKIGIKTTASNTDAWGEFDSEYYEYLHPNNAVRAFWPGTPWSHYARNQPGTGGSLLRVAIRRITNVGLFNAKLTKSLNPTEFSKSVTDTAIFQRLLELTRGYCYTRCERPDVMIGITTLDGLDAWGVFDADAYFQVYSTLNYSPGGWNHYYYQNSTTRVLAVTRSLTSAGTFDGEHTKYLNPSLFPNAAPVTLADVENRVNSASFGGDQGRFYPPTIRIGILMRDLVKAYGEFDSEGTLDLHSGLRAPVPYTSTAWKYAIDNPTKAISVFSDSAMPDIGFARYTGEYMDADTKILNKFTFPRYPFTLNIPTLFVALNIPIVSSASIAGRRTMIVVRLPDGSKQYGELDVVEYVRLYPDAANNPFDHWLYVQGIGDTNYPLTPVVMRLEVTLMGEEIASKNYNQFGCKCTQASRDRGFITKDNKCDLFCESDTLSPGGQECSGRGVCMAVNNGTNSDACVCNKAPGWGGIACNQTVLRDTTGQVCAGADRGSILYPTTVGQTQSCVCNSPEFNIIYSGANCSAGNITKDCAFTGLCVRGRADCTHAGANRCGVTGEGISGPQGTCAQNSTQGDYYCFCRPGAFEGPSCAQPLIPALKTKSNTLISCTGRGEPDPSGTGFCLCNKPYMGHMCELDPRNRPCTFDNGLAGQSYVDGESNGLDLVFD